LGAMVISSPLTVIFIMTPSMAQKREWPRKAALNGNNS
jgi:hypothetical protein